MFRKSLYPLFLPLLYCSLFISVSKFLQFSEWPPRHFSSPQQPILLSPTRTEAHFPIEREELALSFPRPAFLTLCACSPPGCQHHHAEGMNLSLLHLSPLQNPHRVHSPQTLALAFPTYSLQRRRCSISLPPSFSVLQTSESHRLCSPLRCRLRWF
jgi:hypothetical protein